MKPAGRLAVALAAVAAAAGCFGAEDAKTFEAALTEGRMARGYDYAGTTLVPASGTLAVSLDAAADTGLVAGNLTVDGEPWGVLFDAFAEEPGKPFMEGGIVLDLAEHGDTGVGDASLPKLHALVAAWGTATLARGGLPWPDPYTGKTAWSAHLMVTDTPPRGPDGVVAKADGSTPYDPATPGDARALEGTRQAILVLRSPPGQPNAAPYAENWTDTVTAPDYARDWTIATVKDAAIAVNVTVAPATPAPLLAELTFTLLDPEGKELATATLGGPNRETTALLAAVAVDSGDYVLRVTGSGVQAAYAAAASAAPPGPQLHTFWFQVD